MIRLLILLLIFGGCAMNDIKFGSNDLQSGEYLSPIASYYCPFDSSEMTHNKDNHIWLCPKCPYTRDDMLVLHKGRPSN